MNSLLARSLALFALTLGLLGFLHLHHRPLLGIQSSTEAWTMLQVQRAAWLGDHGLAAAIGLTPNLAFDPLYPWLLGPFAPAEPGGDLAPLFFAGHVLSAFGWALGALCLAGLWRAATGSRWAGLAGGAAMLLPPVVGTAALARYDALGIGLALSAGACAFAATRRPGATAFALAGALVGLTHLTREYLALPALSALVAAGASAWADLPRWRRKAARTLIPWLLAALAGLGLGAGLLPLALGLSPGAGIAALLHFGAHGRAAVEARPGPLLLCLVGLPGFFVGWGGARQARLVLGAMLLPFVGFLASSQQSPQYYLLGAVVLLSGLGGLVGALPGRVLPPLGAALLLALGLAGSSAALRPAHGPRTFGFHSEVWPCPTAELEAVVDQAAAWAEGGPLLFVSGGVENIDGLASLRLSRPVAFAYPFELDKLDRLAPEYDGRDITVVLVEQRQAPPPDFEPVLARWEGACLVALRSRIAGKPLDHPGGCGPEQPRGACAQAWWLEGGLAGLEAGARAFQARWRPGLLGFRQ